MGASKFAELVAAKTQRTDRGSRGAVRAARQREHARWARCAPGRSDFGSLGQGAMLSVAPEVAALGLPFLFSTPPGGVGSARRSCRAGPREEDRGSKNLVFLGWWCNGIRQTTNNKRPITKPDDLKGLKIRTPLDPATVDMFAAMGANPAADQLGRGLPGPAERRGRRPGEPAGEHLRRQAVRGAEVHHLHQPQV